MRLALVFAVVLTGCAVKDPGPNDPGVVCTAIAVSSLNVTVRDAATGQRVCDAAVVAVQGSDRYELQQMGGCGYAGPWERAGSFELTVARAGYETAQMSGIRVTADECHVIPVSLTVDLRPAF
jgi:hypothetical protein